uniref:Uncharacterized protein n=1 Tax=Meloidogyne javanica TaxID=6303 RepID=A0A915M947_MELJA
MSWISLEFAFQMIVPVLTSIFTFVSVDDIQASCYKILDSLYLVNGLSIAYSQRRSIQIEVERHRAALGQCLGAFAATFPVAFLENEFNSSNKLSVLAKSREQSVQVQEMLQNLSQHIPQLDKILLDIEQTAEKGVLYIDSPNTFDVDLPLICSYLAYWWQFGPEGPNRPSLPITQVSSEHINRFFCSLLRLMRDHIGREIAPWLCRAHSSAVPLIQFVSCDPVKDYLLPVAEHLRNMAEKAYTEEERMRTHPDEADDAAVAEDNARLVRDVYAFFPILMKYTDLHRAKWLKTPSWESDGIYENVAVIFRIWSLSQHFKREELNYMAQFEDNDTEDGGGAGGEMKTGKAAIAERKKRRREGQVRRNKHANSIVIACLKRLLPVGLNVFGGRELDIVQQSKERFLAKENEDKVREFIKGRLLLPVRTDPTDKNAWQLNLYRKIGKSQMRGKEEMSHEAVVDKIVKMGQTEHPQSFKPSEWKKMVSNQRKRAVVACFRMIPVYSIPRHRGINLFLPVFSQKWLADEDVDQDRLVADVCASNTPGVASTTIRSIESASPVVAHLVEDETGLLKIEEGPNEKQSNTNPDALSQLIQCFQRAATSEESGNQSFSTADDKLFIRYAKVMCRSVHIDKEDEDGGGGENDKEVDQAEKEEMVQALRVEQAVLANRGAAIMCLMYLSAANGEPNEMVAETLQLGIHLLSGGNKDIQKVRASFKEDT